MTYGENWDEIRKKVYQRDCYQCRLCGAKGYHVGGSTELHAHHIVPLSKTGTNTPSNILTLCWSCHNAQHDGEVSKNLAEKQSGGEFSHTPPKLYDISLEYGTISQSDVIRMQSIDEPFSKNKYKKKIGERKREKKGYVGRTPSPNQSAEDTLTKDTSAEDGPSEQVPSASKLARSIAYMVILFIFVLCLIFLYFIGYLATHFSGF